MLQTLRDRLPIDNAVHFAAQLPLLIRGLYFEGWERSKAPVKMSREEFLGAVSEKIVADRFIDPVRITQSVLAVITSFAPGEAEKVKHCFLQRAADALAGDSARALKRSLAGRAWCSAALTFRS